jgi:hypothetical protein
VHTARCASPRSSAGQACTLLLDLQLKSRRATRGKHTELVTAAASYCNMPDPCCGGGKGKYCNTCSVNTSVIISQHMKFVHCLCCVGIRISGQ